MTVNRFYSLTLMVFVIGLGYLSFLVMRPFLSPIAWAIVLSMVFYPLYAFLRNRVKWESLASLITLAVILLIILGPFSYLTLLLVNELKSISAHVESSGPGIMEGALQQPTIKAAIQWVTSIFNITEADIDKTIMDNISNAGKEMVGRITRNVADIMAVALHFVFMSFAIFFLLKDGTKFLRRARDYMPFSEEQKDRLETQVQDIIISTVYGGVVVALSEGIMGVVSFAVFGIPSPVVWGIATAISSFIPLLGAFAVWAPVTVYLFVQGQVLSSIALGIIGLFGIIFFENILKPVIIGGRTKMPIVVIFFSVLGGIQLFGLIGLVTGPLVLAIFVSVVEIFRNIEGTQNA
ncbi:MAG: AI-2E family transporter [Nitrospirales bacterium]|nr:AI-2E family transporter [Nitrospirales bacterium]